MVFDIKMEDFKRTGGHVKYVPPLITYSSVFSNDIVCISLTIFVLNYLEVTVAYIMIVYLTDTVNEKICNIMDPKFCGYQ